MARRGLVAALLLSSLMLMPASVWAACSQVVVFFEKGDTLDVINLASNDILWWGLVAYRNNGELMFDVNGVFPVPDLDPHERFTLSAKDLYEYPLFSGYGLGFDNSYLRFSAISPVGGLFSLTVTRSGGSVYQPQCAAP